MFNDQSVYFNAIIYIALEEIPKQANVECGNRLRNG